jgi:hypothetical protein
MKKNYFYRYRFVKYFIFYFFFTFSVTESALKLHCNQVIVQILAISKNKIVKSFVYDSYASHALRIQFMRFFSQNYILK